jgi:hypothetical protein
MTWTPTKYRYIDFIGGNILDASNVSLLQAITEGGVTSSDVAVPIPGLAQLYQLGTLLNAVFNIAGTGSGTSITFTHANASYPVYVLVNDRFESLGNTVTITISPTPQPSSGTHNLFLNWSWDKVDYTTDASFIDGITGESTIEAGQLSLDVSWTDTHGSPSGSQFAKNSAAIVLAIFDFDTPTTTVTYINGVFPYAEGNPNQAGLVELTDTTGVAVGTDDMRTYDSRPPAPGSVYSSSVATKLQTGLRSSILPAWLPSLASPGAQVVDSHGNVQTCLGTSVGPAFAAPLPVPPHIPVTLVTDLVAVTAGPVYTLGDWNTIAGGITLQAISNNPPYSSLSWSWRNDGTAGTAAYDPAASVVFTLTGVTVTGTTAVYAGTITGSIGSEAITGAGNALAGLRFNITGFTNAGNNGFEMLCTASSASSLTFTNPYGVTESIAATASLYQGGISSDDIIYKTQQESLTAYLDSLATIIAGGGVVTSVFARKGDVIAQSGDYTASQVGAAPASHVGTSLGLGTSHPASVTSDTGGFSVQEATGTVSGDAYTLSSSGSIRKAAITHTGDVYSLLTSAAVAHSGGPTGGADTATYKGSLGLLSLIANVLAEHVSYTAAGGGARNNNPHGLVATDVGAATQAYVDAQISSILSDVSAYTDAKINISVRSSIRTGTLHSSPVAHIYYNADGLPTTSAFTAPTTMTWFIFNIGGQFELALGAGKVFNQDQVLLPEATGWDFTHMLAIASNRWMHPHYDGDTSANMVCAVEPTTFIVRNTNYSDGHSEDSTAWANVMALDWRTILPAPIFISAYDSTAGLFDAGHVGDNVIVTGRNFGSVQGTTVAKFNGAQAIVYPTWSSNSFSVTIPVGATTGPVTLYNSIGSVLLATSPFVFTIS